MHARLRDHTRLCDDGVRRGEARMYFAHLKGVWPGCKVPSFRQYPDSGSTPKAWTDDDYRLLIEEGRRQLDAQREQFEQVRSRGQFLLTTSIGLGAVALAGRSRMFSAGFVPHALWAMGFVFAVLGFLGSASVIVARKDIGSIDAAKMVDYKSPVLSEVGKGYSRQVKTGANTAATLVTVYRDAVFLVLLAAIAWGAAWVVAVI